MRCCPPCVGSCPKSTPGGAAWTRENKGPLMLAELSWLVSFHMFEESWRAHRGHRAVGEALFRLIEVLLLVEDVLWADEHRHDDAAEVGAFARAGIICDVTRTRESLETLLPWMGPECVACSRDEVAAHSTSRGFAVDDVDWAIAGTRFIPLDLDPTGLAPLGEGASHPARTASDRSLDTSCHVGR